MVGGNYPNPMADYAITSNYNWIDDTDNSENTEVLILGGAS